MADCGFSDTMLSFKNWATHIDNDAVMPFYMIVGLFSNSLLLMAFYKHTKKDDGYAYSATLAFTKILEIINFTLFYFSFKWCAAIETKTGCPWFLENYVLMFHAAHLAVPMVNAFITISLLLSVAMSADRFFSLIKPFLYKNLNHKKHQKIAALLCFVLGISTSAFEVGRWGVIWPTGNGTFYIVQYDLQYMNMEFSVFSWHFRTAIRILAVMALITLNIALVAIFRRRVKKVGQMVSDNREKERKAVEKSLITLTVCQSILSLVAQVPLSSLAIATAASPMFQRCYSSVMAPFTDMAVGLTAALDFFVIIAISKKLRGNVLDALRIKCC